MGLWADQGDLDLRQFRERSMPAGTSLLTAGALRDAAFKAALAPNEEWLDSASHDLYRALWLIGPEDWPAFLDGAEHRARDARAEAADPGRLPVVPAQELIFRGSNPLILGSRPWFLADPPKEFMPGAAECSRRRSRASAERRRPTTSRNGPVR